MENAKRKGKFAERRITIIIAVVCLLALPLLFSGCTTTNNVNNETPGKQKPKEIEELVELNILCVGDVMVHKTQISSQYDRTTGKYDYSNNYKYVKDYIGSADLALCNVETTFAGAPYSGYPAFCAPDELAFALKDAGFDVAMTANNHMMDKGGSGLKRTLEVLRGQGFATAGSRMSEEENRYSISEVNGLKVAVIPYTYETSAAGSSKTSLNGNIVSADNANLINSFSYNTWDQDIIGIQETCKAAKDDGADIVILYYHWGEEYQMSANEWQRKIAQQSIDTTEVDIVFGSHPHVLQEMEYLTNATTGKKVPVFYSMGNFISNQREETLDNRYTEQGVIAKVQLQYMKSEGKVTNITMSAVPTWVEKYNVSGGPVYEIIPLDEKLQENETLQASGHLNRAERALEDANGILKAD